MKYTIQYMCLTHPGLCRGMNQDNVIFGRQYLPLPGAGSLPEFPVTGETAGDVPILFGVFDGMGGEACGEIASYLAARTAADSPLTGPPLEELEGLCAAANDAICAYSDSHGVGSMGTTAALLLFSGAGVSLCNIGDSKIFLYSGGQLKQISQDHISAGPFGRKPPLSQNLGIPPTELLIRPYYARGEYHDGDLYLLCSDGLTDMVPTEEISGILTRTPFPDLADTLLQRALDEGGKDNITLILCRIQREKTRFKDFLFRKRDERYGTHRSK